MQIGSRFPVAVHILLFVEIFRDKTKVTSDVLAGSVNTNPVVIRKIMGQLKAAGLISICTGTGGIDLLRSPQEITLLDVYRAVEATDKDLFKFNKNATQECLVGGNLYTLLNGHFHSAQLAMENSLQQVTLQQLLSELDRLSSRKIEGAMLPESGIF
jgi:Rrf2 family protein